MFSAYGLKEWLSWPLIRAHLCTLAVAFSFNSTWRAPRQAFRYGGLPYLLVFTIAMVIVALPVVLLQLAVGQLSQQDSVGVWRAVPFFRGIGYLRLLVSFLASIYSCIYLSLTITYFLYTLSHSIPFWDCMELIPTLEGYESPINASDCLDVTFMAPVNEKPEYYLAVALIIIILWITFPFLLYNPIKLMKRIYYLLGPLILLVGVIILSCVGDRTNVQSFIKRDDWVNFLQPDIWHDALVQALLSSQIAGGFLILAGDSIYASTNVQWTAVGFVGTTVIATWACVLFWFGLSTPDQRYTREAAVLVLIYQTADENMLNVAWPLLMFVTLFISGVITMLTLLYPIYDRLRRAGGVKWRLLAMCTSIICAGITLATLAERLPALTVMEDTAVPIVASIATVLEMLAFVFIYGWKVLVEDVEFLTGHELPKFWVWGWCATPGIIVPFFVWLVIVIFSRDSNWRHPPWSAVTVITTLILIFIILVICASVTVWRQVQYDIIGKLKSSFQPSRHWGPRDPITHYYWLARRDETDRNVPRNRYSRRQLGQLSRRPSFLNVPSVLSNKDSVDNKRRSNSDDWLYTVYRKGYLENVCHDYEIERKRSKSLDWTATGGFKQSLHIESYFKEPVDLHFNNNNIVSKINDKISD